MSIFRSVCISLCLIVCHIPALAQESASQLAVKMHAHLETGEYKEAFHISSLLRRKITVIDIIINQSCFVAEYFRLCYENDVNLDVEKELNQVVEMYRQAYIDDHDQYKKRIKDIIEFYFDKSNEYGIAVKLIDVLLKDREILTTQEQASLLVKKGWCLNYTQYPFDAYMYFQEAANLSKTHFGEYSRQYAEAMNGVAYESRYLRKDPLPLYHQLSDIYKNVYGEESIEMAICYDNIGGMYTNRAMLDSALHYTHKALELFEALDASSMDMAKCYNNLGALKILQGDTATAISMYLMANNYQPVSTPLYNLSLIYYNKRDYNQALLYLSSMSEDFQNMYAANIAQCYAALREKDKFAEYERKYLNYVRKVLHNNFRKMINSEREEYLTDAHDCNIDSLFPTALKFDNEEAAAVCYDYLLIRKSLLLSFNKSLEKIVASSADERLEKMYAYSIQLKQLAEVNHSFKAKADSVERALLLSLQDYGIDYTSLIHTSTADIAAAIGSKDLAIEFFEADQHDMSSIYAVTLNSNGKAAVIFVCHREEAEKGYNIWEPLQKIIANYENIFFSLDGILHMLPVESYFDREPSTDSPTRMLYRLSSTRELVTHKAKANGHDAYLYGGITYDNNDKDIAEAQEKSGSKAREAIKGLDPLPGTLTEVQGIFKQMQKTKNNSIKPHLKTGKNGTESSFKALDEKKARIVHIATHGYFLDEEDSAMEEIEKRYDLDNFMNHSGLFLAGAQSTLCGENTTNADDGILTAQEISLLDLRGLELVVMSACETAKGKLHGDGVFGLQRGFKQAGAQSIIMSLWSVDDEATSLLMTEFYRNWIIEHKTKYQALELAKQVVKSHREKGWDDPKYWAAFILLDGLE